jgi:MFS family permease
MQPRLPSTVIALGLVSFFNDLASEIVVPLVPILLATVLGAGPVALGLIEGVADAIAAALRLWSGRRSDQLGGRRKGLVLAGYALSNLVRPLLALAGSWMTVLVLRSFDRVGKGLRTAPRDALVSDATPAAMRGYAYGFQRALDNGGAVGGSLIAAGVLAWSTIGLQQMILLSVIPGALAVLCVVFGVRITPSPSAPPLLGKEGRTATTPSPSAPPFLGKEGRTPATPSPSAPPLLGKEGRTPTTPSPSAPPLLGEERVAAAALPPLRWSALGVAMRRYLAVIGLFTLARASETFIVLLGHQRGASTVELLVLWAALSLAKSITATQGGKLADRLGRIAPIALSWTALAVGFVLLAVLPGQAALWVVTVGYGLFAGLGEGAERALIGDFSQERERGTAFGWYNLMLGLFAVPAGVMFGGLWQVFGAPAAFATAGVLGVAAVALLLAWVRPAMRAA